MLGHLSNDPSAFSVQEPRQVPGETVASPRLPRVEGQWEDSGPEAGPAAAANSSLPCWERPFIIS